MKTCHMQPVFLLDSAHVACLEHYFPLAQGECEKSMCMSVTIFFFFFQKAQERVLHSHINNIDREKHYFKCYR